MTKRELLKELQEQLHMKNMSSITGIGINSNKSEIINAIECLKCSDEELLDCLDSLKAEYLNIYEVVTKNSSDLKSFMTHSHNRLFIYNLGKSILKGDE